VTSSEYWSIDIPGLTYEQALRIKEFATRDAEWGVILADPRTTMVRSFDAATVRLIVRCLIAGLNSESLGPLDEAGARSLLEDCEAWFEQADEAEPENFA
jgi:hypothetical protein